MTHTYKDLQFEEQQQILDLFVINSWSYSKVMAFARHQLAFEMQYIFGLYSRSSVSTIAGKAYHKALEVYFTQLKDGVVLPLPELEAVAYQFIGEFPGNQWKLGKTTPTIEKAMEEVLKTTNKLIYNFYSEKSEYEDDIEEILGVEEYFAEWLTVNGVDVPLPCHGIIDMRVRTRRNTIAIIDHKSKSTYTDPKAQEMVIGPQAITYALGAEAKWGIPVDEVWFMENKSSENKDKTVQIKPIRQKLDINTRRLFESILYGNLRQMISAVKDPDHIYTFNPSDSLTDMAELSDFYYRTLFTDIEGFNVEPGKKELVAKRLKKIRDSNIQAIPLSVIKAFKEKAASFIQYDLSVTNMTSSEKIEHAMRSFGTLVKVAHKFEGYSSNTFLLEVTAGTRVASLYSKRLDLANALDVPNVRISSEMVVYEGKSYMGIEISKKRDRDLLFDANELKGTCIPIGKDNLGNTIYWDIAEQSTPNMLVCGMVGSGKTVCIRNILEHAPKAGFKEIVILDPKHEFKQYNTDEVPVFNDIIEIEHAMANLVKLMQQRIAAGQERYTLVIIDELADAIDQSRSGNALNIYREVQIGKYANGLPKTKREVAEKEKSLEENLKMLLQKGRSSGFRVIAGLQRASTKIITGDAKVNFPVQVCFKVPKAIDSKVVLDEEGAESLAGKGDGLIKSPQYPQTVRFQSFYKA